MPVTYEELQQQLLQKEVELKSQLEDVQSSVREEGVGYSNHMADAGSEVFEQARDVSLARTLKRSFEDVTRALNKFEDGTYGLCESCGTVIELARLEALPSARYCMRCQTRLEGKR
ncbi:MAG: TraR/DksA C4-type zinc finger protein [Anaerolineae bacterium]|nr:TraR/DksA C4-type zinc finger protein [Anaerolineae bacterium]